MLALTSTTGPGGGVKLEIPGSTGGSKTTIILEEAYKTNILTAAPYILI